MLIQRNFKQWPLRAKHKEAGMHFNKNKVTDWLHSRADTVGNKQVDVHLRTLLLLVNQPIRFENSQEKTNKRSLCLKSFWTSVLHSLSSRADRFSLRLNSDEVH